MLAGKFSDRKIWDSSANWPAYNHKSASRRHLALPLDCITSFLLSTPRGSLRENRICRRVKGLEA